MPLSLDWPAPLATLDASRRRLTLAVGISLFLHAILLSIHFKLPEKLDHVREQALDVILVNAKHAEKPVKTQAKAQANLDAGGNIDAPRRAKTPLPPSRESHSGDDLIAARQRVALLEQQQRELITKHGTEHAIRPQTEPTLDAHQAEISGRDLATAARALVRLEAEIARSIDEYNQRPKRKFIGARVEEYRFAQYVEDWRQKVERVGNLNYPEAARGKLYGSLILTVAIKSDGSLERVELNRSSGHKVLDEAAQRIVRLAAPFAAFPENIRRDTDIIEITRTWTFTGADRLATQ
ncbi:energy transducer TonB [Sulfuricystis multivorans]|uniref:energy transducer TonB n=1 Tax=Sulfuricystis multivorans TaxID=2211108 RepID=UPI000F8341C2|nr:TonB family protein [Sulfuricystis multivorans]